MSRPLVQVEIDGKELIAILDTGSRRSYVKTDLAQHLPAVAVHPFQARIGGETVALRSGVVVSGTIRDTARRGYRFGDILFPVNDLGNENGVEIHVLFGAGTLEDWGAVIDESTDPPQVDYRILREGELIEL